MDDRSRLRALKRQIVQAELRAGARDVARRRCYNRALRGGVGENEKKLLIAGGLRIRGGDGDETCAICLQPIDSEKVLMPCGHAFHRACIKQWMLQQCTCPMCRRDFRQDPTWLAQNEDFRCGNRLDTSTINVSRERTYDDTFTDVEIAWLKELFPDYDHRRNIFHDLRSFPPDIRRTMWEMVDDQISQARRDTATMWLQEADKRREWKASLIQAWLLSKENLFLDPASYDHSIPWYRQPGVDAFLRSEVKRINETWVETVGRTLFGWWS